MENPVVLLGHDADKDIGIVVEYNLDEKGLEIVAEIRNDIDGVMERIENKTLRGFSIGWRCLSCEYKEEESKMIRIVTELDLAEISVVSVPANPKTLFTLAKSLQAMFAEMETKEAEEAQAMEEELEDESGETEETPKEDEIVGETPTESEQSEEVQTEETSEVVEADQETPQEEAPDEDEVKSLISTYVDQAIEAKLSPLLEKNAQLEAKLAELETKNAQLDDEIRQIEVPTKKVLQKTLIYNV
jgi:HK97 family phage prohead protease